MDPELLLKVISRIAHVGTAILLVGGAAFLRLAVLPSLEGDATELLGRIRGRWKKFVHGGIAIMLISGFYNFFTLLPSHKGDPLYHALVGTKILFAFFLFFLASVLVGRSPGTQKYRDNAKKWLTVMLIVASAIVAISGFVKVRPFTPTATSWMQNPSGSHMV